MSMDNTKAPMAVTPADHVCSTLRGGTVEGQAYQRARYGGGLLCQPMKGQPGTRYVCCWCAASVDKAKPL